MNVIGYLRVSTDEQANSGLGLDAQRATIQTAADARGWDVVWIEDAGHSAKTLKRPGIVKALAMLKKGEASGLVVAKARPAEPQRAGLRGHDGHRPQAGVGTRRRRPGGGHHDASG